MTGRYLSRRVADLRIGRGCLWRWVSGIVRFVGLEPPALDVISGARYRLLGGPVVRVDPRSRRPVPIRPIVVVPGSDALAAVLHPVARIAVNGAEEARVVVGHVGFAHGRRQGVRVPVARRHGDALGDRRHGGPAPEVDDDSHVDVVAHRVRRRDGDLQRDQCPGTDLRQHGRGRAHEQTPREHSSPAPHAAHATRRCPFRPPRW